ncbi:MAG: hypothetical protein JRL30_01965 [Deltaproteobacteria bacterium]|nr:hypothetical protein [Deltaproteobacteria bacterium]
MTNQLPRTGIRWGVPLSATIQIKRHHLNLILQDYPVIKRIFDALDEFSLWVIGPMQAIDSNGSVFWSGYLEAATIAHGCYRLCVYLVWPYGVSAVFRVALAASHNGREWVGNSGRACPSEGAVDHECPQQGE